MQALLLQRVVKNIKIAPSPEVDAETDFAACGIRPINNYSRYYKLCYGRIMVSLCMLMIYDTIADHKIVVRRAEDGEKFVTLRWTGKSN